MGFQEVMEKASAGDPHAQNALGYIYYKGVFSSIRTFE